jgi:tetratricopeptide (TPR) repeat protein
MGKSKTCVVVATSALAVLLVGCSHPPLPLPGPGRLSPTAMVEAIRAARNDDHSVVQVVPLRDPAVDGYLDGARADEAAGRYQDALQKIDAALQLTPQAPDILQFRAEVEILLRDYPAAATDAQRSFALGPRVGGLCASNWQTLLEIAETNNDQAGVQAARKARDACHKAGPVRM